MQKPILIIFLLLLVSMTGYSKNNHQILVASYNIRYDNPHDGENSWANRKEHVKELIRFHDFDIFGIQEGLINQVQGIAELDQYAWYGKGRDDGQQAGEHCAIFYKKERFRMLESGDFWLSETPDKPTIGWDSRVNKRICTWAKFRDVLTKKTFCFISVHFDNIGAEARRQSAKLMVFKIREIAGNLPVICVGDFNSGPDSEQIATMESLLKDAYKVSIQPPYGPVGTSSGFGYNPERRRGNRIDYIFVSDRVTVNQYGVLTDYFGDYRYSSDHFPIVAKIVIN